MLSAREHGREGVAEPVEGRLGGRVAEQGPQADRSVGGRVDRRLLLQVTLARGDVDDDAAATSTQVGRDEAGEDEWGVDVDVELAAPRREWVFVDRGRAPLRVGGVVHEDVDAAEVCDGGLHEHLEVLGFGEVAGDGERVSALRFDQRDGLSHRADESSVRFDGAGGDDDLRAVPGEGERELPTDAAAGAGHDRHSIVELHVNHTRRRAVARWPVARRCVG